MKHTIRIDKRTGMMEFLDKAPPGLELPSGKRFRYSEIVPMHGHLYYIFRILRWMFGETGHVAAWTRRWRCRWDCTILTGPHRGKWRTSRDRDHLVQWERELFLNGGAQ